MTIKQHTFLILTLFKSNTNDLEKEISNLILDFEISESDIEMTKQKILDDYKLGVSNLNSKQFDNLIQIAKNKILDEIQIVDKLNFYEVDKKHHNHIVNFLKGYHQSNKQIEVSKIDSNFKGVQVATYDDFNKILELGYTGNWLLDPNNVKPRRIQIASMSETGSHTRGYYINADIEKMEPLVEQGKTRYRIYLKNPKIVNSGNRNIKFSNNPVRYIR